LIRWSLTKLKADSQFQYKGAGILWIEALEVLSSWLQGHSTFDVCIFGSCAPVFSLREEESNRAGRDIQ
jgi:hypothetical protein